MIRITGGEFRSRLLATPNTDKTKPTMDKVRQAVFSILTNEIYDTCVCDLFAGSGSYGFESLSRGAKKVTFVDKAKLSMLAVKDNANNLKINQKTEFVLSDVISFLKSTDCEFDIAFADPPYKLEIYEEMIDYVLNNKVLKSGGIFVVESENKLKITNDNILKIKEYNYGIANIYVIRKK